MVEHKEVKKEIVYQHAVNQKFTWWQVSIINDMLQTVFKKLNIDVKLEVFDDGITYQDGELIQLSVTVE